MALPTLPLDTNLATINNEDRVTRCNLQVNPMTAALAAPFAAFMGTNWRNAFLLEIQLEDDLALASARILYADRVLKFATTGERRKVIDDYNALRKSTCGELGKLQHQNPDLPNDFADSFFRHESRRGDDKLSPEQLKQKIDGLVAQQETPQKKLEAAHPAKKPKWSKRGGRAATPGAGSEKEGAGRIGCRHQEDGGGNEEVR